MGERLILACMVQPLPAPSLITPVRTAKFTSLLILQIGETAMSRPGLNIMFWKINPLAPLVGYLVDLPSIIPIGTDWRLPMQEEL